MVDNRGCIRKRLIHRAHPENPIIHQDKVEIGGAVIVDYGSNGESYHPAYNYPGLLLGCLKDPRDGHYCATKRARTGDMICDFYMSCCYGEYLAGEYPVDLIGRVETYCPGSTIYANQTCSSSSSSGRGGKRGH